ncbi:alpha/beta fold hydrolase [Litorilituus lipolyticus]|uniref:Alpha/beta fold hydrolase n=1 Tax=Litorilituus lipolyticus TaxID=2491017 RepID=A0A502KQW4_9GAMM|nr:alpha/beta fold hydrolase [Litorilituus lipolyticus]TPH13876.1 alpha/beta fold hydrolase [Litorilituus lipolyticus]
MTTSAQTDSPLLNYQQVGQGEHIILIHGLFGSLENLNMVAKTLAHDFTVTSIDVRNHGGSFHAHDMDYSVLARDVINLLDYLAINKAHILGHSMGGKIAMQIALEHGDRINKLVVADIAPIQYPNHHQQIINGLKAIDLAKVHKRKDADDQLSDYVQESGVRQFLLRNIAMNEQKQFYFKCNLAFIDQCYSQIMQANTIDEQDNSHFAQTFEKPTLFIKGGNSDYILPEHQAAIVKLFPASKAKVIQGAGHWLHAEKTTAFNKIVLNFLNSE